MTGRTGMRRYGRGRTGSQPHALVRTRSVEGDGRGTNQVRSRRTMTDLDGLERTGRCDRADQIGYGRRTCARTCTDQGEP